MGASCAPTGVPDARSWLASSAAASAAAAADEVVSSLGTRAPADLALHLETAGLAPLLAWADALKLGGLDREPWARDAALRAVQAYVARLGELAAASVEGGRS